MVWEEITKECNGIDLSCKKTLTHRKAKNQCGDDGDEDNVAAAHLSSSTRTMPCYLSEPLRRKSRVEEAKGRDDKW